MKKHLLITAFIFLSFAKIAAKSKDFSTNHQISTYVSEFETNVTFPAGYAIGDYVEFLRVNPLSAGASGYFQVSITYTRDGVAAAATHLVAISHSNPAIWRETGRINNNLYVGIYANFTIDCNTEYANPRFRIRAINTIGVKTNDLSVQIKVTSINFNGAFTPINMKGNDLSVSKFLPMTADWDLYVGNSFSADGASIAIKALQNGNVGIGTTTPTSKLTVAGNINSREVKVNVDAGADFVFEKEYDLPSLASVDNYIKQNKHLPKIASAKEMQTNGINLSEMNIKLLQKIEEMTLYMIDFKKQIDSLKDENRVQQEEIETLKETKK